MVHVGRKYLDERLKAKSWQKLEKEIEKGKNLESVLKKFFTSNELIILEKRLAILSLLDSGNSYLEIRRQLDVSPGTVSFIKQGFKINKKPPKTAINSVMKYESRGKRKFPRYKGTRGFGLAEW